ncbi:DUF1688-domain-containing protein [Coniophora puteana RWD-64-598 SS2]|uniref:DUF1688-domain-containing protein n=1 Tax=Coniophora puteana (strain RWD-64-598) TaxID=741705 RepID=R7SG51_CONPW|nr:DUF1688-domain-containing protein [Coniophora puteana RWD-64-598 SS2]EIW74069.1 DUF1688-domain-containing protein [Coniophora puteana RWD-64-598 SS2]
MNLGVTQTSEQSQALYLRTIPAIRERCSRVHKLAEQGRLEYFDYHPDKEDQVAEFCEGIIRRDFGSNFAGIPPHGRWRHLDAGLPRVEPLVAEWNAQPNPPDTKEICRRLVDLFLVSVLLDAGAGNDWTYSEATSGKSFARSEGLGVASVHMFKEGLFSGNKEQPFQVDAKGLSQLTSKKVGEAFQVTEKNPMVGLEGRTSLLVNLAQALKANPTFFGEEARPGRLIDFLDQQSRAENGKTKVHVSSLWYALIEGLAPIWPPRTSIGGFALGDVWQCNALALAGNEGTEALVPFHKLTGWITYSLMEPMERFLGWEFEGVEDMTGLPEYRNGGLLVDFGVLTLRPGKLPADAVSTEGLPRVPPSHPAIIEWRAMTVILLDRITAALRTRLNAPLSLTQVLESATWKGGREIAKQKRPHSGGPPIEIESDGTVF